MTQINTVQQDNWMVTTWCPNLPVTSHAHVVAKLNELSGIGITACSNSFLCNFDGEAKESDEGKYHLIPLAMPLKRDPGA